jgi:hypothetical protein
MIHKRFLCRIVYEKIHVDTIHWENIAGPTMQIFENNDANDFSWFILRNRVNSLWQSCFLFELGTFLYDIYP